MVYVDLILFKYLFGFFFFGCLGVVYVKDLFFLENDVLFWLNNEVSFDELFKVDRILLCEIDFLLFWIVI